MTDRLISLNAAIELLHSDEIREAMDCNKTDKYRVHIGTLDLVEKALRALPDAGEELRDEIKELQQDNEMWIHAQQYPRD